MTGTPPRSPAVADGELDEIDRCALRSREGTCEITYDHTMLCCKHLRRQLDAHSDNADESSPGDSPAAAEGELDKIDRCALRSREGTCEIMYDHIMLCDDHLGSGPAV